jgi:hypothetical protein
VHCDENMMSLLLANIGQPYICCGGMAEPSRLGWKTSTSLTIFFFRQL